MDHNILLEKLHFYGFRNGSLKLITSFLDQRKQYVNIDGKESELMDSLKCSVIQGSKLSSLLYILYTNEIPLLYQLINTPIYSKLTNEQQQIQFEDINNYVIQYVDDSSSIISTSDISSLDKFVLITSAISAMIITNEG